MTYIVQYLPEQLKPSPSVNGGRQVQLKESLSSPSLSQIAFTSQGSLRQGSGTSTNFKQLCVLHVY